MNKPKPAIPSGWDYLILPRRINLNRVPRAPVIMKEDYFEDAKRLVRFNKEYFNDINMKLIFLTLFYRTYILKLRVFCS